MYHYVVTDEYVASLPPIYKGIFMAWSLVDPNGKETWTPEEVVSGFIYHNFDNILKAFDSLTESGVLVTKYGKKRYQLTELGVAIVTAVAKSKLDTVSKFVPPAV